MPSHSPDINDGNGRRKHRTPALSLESLNKRRLMGVGMLKTDYTEAQLSRVHIQHLPRSAPVSARDSINQ